MAIKLIHLVEVLITNDIESYEYYILIGIYHSNYPLDEGAKVKRQIIFNCCGIHGEYDTRDFKKIANIKQNALVISTLGLNGDVYHISCEVKL